MSERAEGATVNWITQLYEALVKACWNQSAAGRVIGVSRETVRLRLKAVGGFKGLLEWAVRTGVASQAEADAWAAVIALAPANRQPANMASDDLAPEDANSHEIRRLREKVGRPIFAADMSTMVAAAIPQSSTVRIEGTRREFAKRVALEVALKTGMPREDMSSVMARMVDYFEKLGDPASVANLLIEGPRRVAAVAEPVPASAPAPPSKPEGEKR